jgi:hypothetical protein
LCHQAEPASSVVDALKARAPDAAYFHAGADHVLRAISEDFQVIGTAGLTKKQVDQFHGALGQPTLKRDVVDERDIVSSVEQSVRRDNEGAKLFERQCPQACPLRGKCSDFVRLSLHQFLLKLLFVVETSTLPAEGRFSHLD